MKDFNKLLGRKKIKVDLKKISKEYLGSTVLITGAAGSIGSEISAQICQFQVKKIICLDFAESPLFLLERGLNLNYPDASKEFVLANIRDYGYMNLVIGKFKPDVIIHCAAYKHVPILERQPDLAIKNNIFGTKTLADLAIKHDVKSFINISSDKAVNPTNVMGATKRFSEIYVHSLSEFKKPITKFISTRFGNVIGSNGSVIPIFRDQIRRGGPVTVTHPEITRYFMTITEACKLVLEASVIGNNGEVFIFDMGKSINISELARIMIKEYGEEKQIDITYTGLRDGEKLYEELLTSVENLKKTSNNNLFIADVKVPSHESVIFILEQISNSLNYDSNDLNSLVKYLKEIMPEFISNNSKYQALDVLKK